MPKLDRDDPLNYLFALAIIEVDAEHGEVICDANDLMCELAGYEAESLNGQSLDILVPDRSRIAHRHYSAGYKARPEARPMGPDREVVLLHASGSEIRVWVGLAPRPDERNDPLSDAFDGDTPIEPGRFVTAAVMPMDIGRSFGLPRISDLPT